MANVIFNKCIADSTYLTPKAKYDSLAPHDPGTFYLVGEELYLGDVLLSATMAAEIEVFDADGHFEGATVEAVLAELFNDQAAKEIWFQDETPASGSEYAKVYKLYQGADDTDMTQNVLKGTINIPKDLVVKSGAVVEIFFDDTDDTLHEGSLAGVDVTEFIIPEGSTATAADAGKYIKLVIQNDEDKPLYIAVKDLVDIYTGGTTAEATVAIDGNNVITVTINKVNATKVIYREAGYRQLTAADTFDSNETYYTYDGTDYTVDSTVDATNFDSKVTTGLYVAVTEQTVKAKIDQVEEEITALDEYVGDIPSGSSATTVIGYVDEKTQGGVSSLNGEAGVASKSASDVVTIKGGVIEVEGVIQNAPNADKASTENVYYDAEAGKIYSDSEKTIEVTPVTNKTYIDQVSGKHFNWTGKTFVEVVPDVVLEKVAVTGDAEDVAYDNTTSEMTATNVQDAIDELKDTLTWNEV